MGFFTKLSNGVKKDLGIDEESKEHTNMLYQRAYEKEKKRLEKKEVKRKVKDAIKKEREALRPFSSVRSYTKPSGLYGMIIHRKKK